MARGLGCHPEAAATWLPGRLRSGPELSGEDPLHLHLEMAPLALPPGQTVVLMQRTCGDCSVEKPILRCLAKARVGLLCLTEAAFHWPLGLGPNFPTLGVLQGGRRAPHNALLSQGGEATICSSPGHPQSIVSVDHHLPILLQAQGGMRWVPSKVRAVGSQALAGAFQTRGSLSALQC